MAIGKTKLTDFEPVRQKLIDEMKRHLETIARTREVFRSMPNYYSTELAEMTAYLRKTLLEMGVEP